MSTRSAVRRRRSAFHPGLEALENRYALDAGGIALAFPLLGPSVIGVTASLTTQAPQALASQALASITPSASGAVSGTSSLTIAEVVSIQVVQVESRDPFRGSPRPQAYVFEVFRFETFVTISARSGGSGSSPIMFDGPTPRPASPPRSTNEPASVASADLPASTHSTETDGSTTTPGANQAGDAAAAALATSIANASNAAAAALSSRRTDPIPAVGVFADRRADRIAPVAFATSVEAELGRPTEALIAPERRTSSPLSRTPFAPVLPDDAEATVEALRYDSSTTPAADLAFAGLMVDGFAPQMIDNALRALHSVEANLDLADGSSWYRMALGCWVVAAAFAYEASRQSRTPVLETPRLPGGWFGDPEDER